MLPTEIIKQKRDQHRVRPADIEAFIAGYVDGTITDYQAAAFLMAAFINGLDATETSALTRAMMTSGEVYDLGPFDLGRTSDKHSTGGVGDKVSLALAPLVASCGVAVPMVSGRGLGHTGGTLDKLESIPGFSVDLTLEQFGAQLKKINTAMIGQSNTFVPADKKLYALRDVTGTVESIELISASIMSKKVASGTDTFVMDVKCGSGAFMKTLPDAIKLGQTLVDIGRQLGRPVRALVTDMSQPLGIAVGNSLEVLEAIDCLKNEGPADLREIVIQLSAEMLLLAGRANDHSSAVATLETALEDGSALNRFRDMVEAQGGNPDVTKDASLFDVSSETAFATATEDGYVQAIDCEAIGLASLVLGAGRVTISDSIDYGVGLKMLRKTGSPVSKGDKLVQIYHRGGRGLDDCLGRLTAAIEIGQQPPKVGKLILHRITEA